MYCNKQATQEEGRDEMTQDLPHALKTELAAHGDSFEEQIMKLETAYYALRGYTHDMEADCRWAMAMIVNGIEGRLMDIHDNDVDKVEKASRRMPAFKRAVAWLEAHRQETRSEVANG
jgi:hypothetical protein